MDAIGSVGISRLARPGGSDSGGPGESRPVPSLVTGDRSLFFRRRWDSIEKSGVLNRSRDTRPSHGPKPSPRHEPGEPPGDPSIFNRSVGVPQSCGEHRRKPVLNSDRSFPPVDVAPAPGSNETFVARPGSIGSIGMGSRRRAVGPRPRPVGSMILGPEGSVRVGRADRVVRRRKAGTRPSLAGFGIFQEGLMEVK